MSDMELYLAMEKLGASKRQLLNTFGFLLPPISFWNKWIYKIKQYLKKNEWLDDRFGIVRINEEGQKINHPYR